MAWRPAALAGLVVVGAAAAAVVAAPPPAVEEAADETPAQELTSLLEPHRVFAEPSAEAARVGTLKAYRPITRGQTTLPVVGRATAGDGADWLQVMLPGRPNGRTGWMRRHGTTPGETGWRLVVSTAAREVLAYRQGHLVRSFSAVVGKPATPTPLGRSFVEESIRMPGGSPGAPFALALSARSEVLQEFEGGPGQIALHGVANIGGEPGTAASHGCVRLADRDIRWLAARITPGVPVTTRP